LTIPRYERWTGEGGIDARENRKKRMRNRRMNKIGGGFKEKE